MIKIFFIYILLFFIVSSCNAQPPLGDQAMLCKPVDSDECIELRDKYERQREARENNSNTPCPPGYALYINHGDARCVLVREMNRHLERTFE